MTAVLVLAKCECNSETDRENYNSTCHPPATTSQCTRCAIQVGIY